MMHYTCDSNVWLHGPCSVTQGPYFAFFSPFLVFLLCMTLFYFLNLFCYFLQNQMVILEVSPEDVLTFDVEDISDTIQSSIALSCSSTTDNSLVLFAVFSNSPLRYSISPDTGFLLCQ
jgi:hypothetical protein